MNKCYFDLETTGPNASTDRIVELAILVEAPDGGILFKKSKRYNPEMPISPEAFKTHGISDDDVKDCPTFSQDATRTKKFFENTILIGHNILRFDIPLIMAEFDRAKVNVELSGQVIDTMQLETLLNPRTLTATFKRYYGEEFDNAHDATADVEATAKVLTAQLAKIKNDELDEQALLAGCGVPEGSADFYGKLKWVNDKLYFKFGKYADHAVLENNETIQYANWMCDTNFPNQVKQLLRDELKKNVAAIYKKPPVEQRASFFPVKRIMNRSSSFAEATKLTKQPKQMFETDDDAPF